MSQSPWQAVCPLSKVPPDAPLGIKIDGQRLVVVRSTDSTVSVFDDACPHEGYPLSKGTLVDGELVCPWHNFRFAAGTGACVKGDEDAIPKPVRIVDGTIEVDLTPAPVEQRRARLEQSLTTAVLEDRQGQMARDIVRLLQLGVSTDDLLALALHLDAMYREWGTSHVFPFVVDIRGRARDVAEAGPATDAVRYIWPVFRLLSEQVVRRPKRPVPAPVVPTHLIAARAEVRARVLAEDAEGAEALARGAIAAGWTLEDVRLTILSCCADHLLNFSHNQIYATKAVGLPSLTTEALADVVGALVYNTATATRDDAIPEWRPVHARLHQAAPRLQAATDRWTTGDLDTRADVERWLNTVVSSSWKVALDATLDALDHGASPHDLATVLVLAGSERMLRFDVHLHADPTLQENWLDATHRLTGAQAVAEAMGVLPWSDWLLLALRTLVWVVRGAPLDGEPTAVPAQPASSEAPYDALRSAVGRRDAPTAMGIVQQLVRHAGPTPALHQLLLDLSLAQNLHRGIIEVHLLKTVQAAREASRFCNDPRPLLAATRLLATPIQEFSTDTVIHEALRFVVDGKVPRTRT